MLFNLEIFILQGWQVFKSNHALKGLHPCFYWLNLSYNNLITAPGKQTDSDK